MFLLNRTLGIWLVVISSLLVSACGFHLREQTTLPPALETLTLSLGTGSYSFNRDIRIALAKAGIQISTEKASKDIHELKVNGLAMKDTVLARASDNDIDQVERRLTVNYFIRNEHGKALWGPRTVSLSIILNSQDSEQSVKSAYNTELMQRATTQLAEELVADLHLAQLKQ